MLSIITAFYNSSKTIPKLIKCLQNQTNNDFEWIIVDDCSEKEEKKRLLTLIEDTSIKAKIESNEINCGPGGARSKGLKKAVGDYVVFVDSDDLISDDFVDTILSNFKHTNAEIVAFDYARINSENIETCVKINNTDKGLVQSNRFILYSKSCICGCAFYRVFLHDNNITFPDLYRYEDWVFNIRAAAKCSKIFYVKKVLYYYIVEPTSLVNSGKYDAGEFSRKAFDLIDKELKLFDKSIAELLYAREVIYVNAVSKVKKLPYKEYRLFMESLKNEKYYSVSKFKDALSLHQRIILKLIDLKMYRVLRIGLDLIIR